MSNNQSKRRDKKRKTRERRVQKNRSCISARRRIKVTTRAIRKYIPLPKFQIDISESTKDMANMVRLGIAEFDRIYTRIVDYDTLTLMHAHVSKGWTALINDQSAQITTISREDIEIAITHHFEQVIGDGIIQNAPNNLIRRVLSTGCYTMKPTEHGWDIKCRSLKVNKTKNGNIYQSPYCPKIMLHNQLLEVSFSKHAIQQLANRMASYWNKCYISQVYVFEFFYECVYFEITKLNNGDRALVIYNSCLRGGGDLRKFMGNLLSIDNEADLSNYYYKVGYCPIFSDDKFIVAKTFLTPGYWQTPERSLLSEKSIPLKLRRDIELACDDGINLQSVCSCKKTRTAIEWFHNHGIPQAKKINCEVFRNFIGPYSYLKSQVGKQLTLPEDA
jgi:hypothetical protein